MTRRPAPPATARRLAAAWVAVPLALAALPGCSSEGRKDPQVQASRDATNAAETQAVERALLRRGDVATVQVRYLDSFANPRIGVVDAVMKAGADPRSIAEAAVRAVWQSRLGPLHSMSVSVTNPQDPPRGVAQDLDLLDAAVRARLEAQYGPRPR